MTARGYNDIEIRDDEEGSGAIVSFPFDAAVAERFREAFPRARWSDQLSAWRLPGTTAMLRAARWLDRELPSAFTLSDERGRDSFSFEPIWARIEAVVSRARTEALASAGAASSKADVVASDLAGHRLHVAEHYVSKAGLREQVGQVLDLVRDVQSDVGSINERLDRVIENRSSGRRSGFKPP